MGLLKQTALTGAILGLVACGGDSSGESESVERIGYIGGGNFGDRDDFNPRLLVGSTLSIGDNFTAYLEFQPSDGPVDGNFVTLEELEAKWNTGSPAISNPVTVSYTASSSNIAVIAIENGNIVAKQPGKATISYTVNMPPVQNNVEISTGEIIVCPYADVALSFGDIAELGVEFRLPNAGSPVELTAINNASKTIRVSATPVIDASTLEQYGLNADECPTDFISATDTTKSSLYYQAITKLNGDADDLEVFSHKEAVSQAAKFFGIDFPNITLTRVSAIENPRITQAGFDDSWILNTINPVTVMAFSTELQKDVDVSHYYIAPHAVYTGVLGLPICSGDFCGRYIDYNGIIDTSVAVNDTTASFVLWGNGDDVLPQVDTPNLAIVKALQRESMNTTHGEIGTVIKVKSELLANDRIYNVSNLYMDQNRRNNILNARNNPDFQIDLATQTFSNMFRTNHPDGSISLLNGAIGIFNNGLFAGFTTTKMAFGAPTDVTYRGRWVQLDNGEEYWILPHSSVVYTKIDDNHLSYTGNDGKTKHLLRTGVDTVALNGSVNLIEEAAVEERKINSGIQSRSLGQTRGLGGIASIDMILSNVNTGEKTTVSVDDTGNFTETVPTGDYKLQGTIEDNSILYNVDKKITVEKNITYAGKLNLAKVDLYNFESNISGCEHNYKCYGNKNYQFTITVKNTGLIDSSGVIAAIEDISVTNPLVTSFTTDNLDISGYAVGDSKTYTFNMTFSQPAEDTVIEVPFSITDINSRTWSDTLYIPLSKYDPMTINVIGARANIIIDGRTALPINGSVTVPKKFGSTYELIVSNEAFSTEAVYGIGIDAPIVEEDLIGFTDLPLNEPDDNMTGGATELNLNDKHVSYISVGDVDFYQIVITDPSL